MAKTLRRSNLSEDAYAVVRDMLLQGDAYGPGDKINVDELCAQLGISRTPLWAAIYRLEAERILEVVPRRGVYLVSYDPERVLDIYMSREALEGMAARLAATNVTDLQLSLLQQSIDQQRAALANGDNDGYYTSALEFHEVILRATQNRTLERLLRSVFSQIRIMRSQRDSIPTHLPRSCNDHEKILKALRKRDPDLAEREARNHIKDLAAVIRADVKRDAGAKPKQIVASRRRRVSS
ncbi:GntR family transcriptional regulator [Bradyrhizobium sp. NP1]|uniref:GntR family transcriptional regulator n=1 Tax=Bradyrhizobium sp. NP1 TaxID=3049772 RepID=UPI0025A67021|nr:GntR family transcriptional regulator [Bradyrhizobium sp. NP1]WJR76834.1 GntR family transcriptional regulator [Bradyrhizobium sp. NP1]